LKKLLKAEDIYKDSLVKSVFFSLFSANLRRKLFYLLESSPFKFYPVTHFLLSPER
jgi:hypothetical protein